MDAQTADVDTTSDSVVAAGIVTAEAPVLQPQSAIGSALALALLPEARVWWFVVGASSAAAVVCIVALKCGVVTCRNFVWLIHMGLLGCLSLRFLDLQSDIYNKLLSPQTLFGVSILDHPPAIVAFMGSCMKYEHHNFYYGDGTVVSVATHASK